MLLSDRDTPISDMAWSGLERMTEVALKMHTEQQAATSGKVGGGLEGGGKGEGLQGVTYGMED